MADEVVDGLLFESRFDESGLDASARAQIAAVQRIVREATQIQASIPPLALSVAPLQDSLRLARASVVDTAREIQDTFDGIRPRVALDLTPIEATLTGLPRLIARVDLPPIRILASLAPVEATLRQLPNEIRALPAAVVSVRGDLAPFQAAVSGLPAVITGLRVPPVEVRADTTAIQGAVREVVGLLTGVVRTPPVIPLLADPTPFERTLALLPAEAASLHPPAVPITADVRPFVAAINEAESVRDELSGAPFQVPIDVESLGRFREELRRAAGDTQAAARLFREFSAGAEAELRTLGVTGENVARIISRLWNEVQNAARAADRARAPIAALESGLTTVARLLTAGRDRRLLNAGPDIADVRALNAELAQTVRTVAETRSSRLLAPAAVQSIPQVTQDVTGQAAQAERLRQAVQAEADALRQQSAALTETRQRVDEMSAAEAQAAIATLRASGASRQAADALRLQAEAARRTAEATAQAQRVAAAGGRVVPPPPPTPPDPNLRIRAEGLIGFRTAALDAKAAAEALKATMLQEGQASRTANAGTQAWAAGLENLRQQNEKLNAGLGLSAAGATRLRAGLTALAVQASGTSPAIGSVITGLLLLGAGSAVVTGVAAGIAVIATAYDFFTRKTREARKATDEFIAAQIKAAQARNPAADLRNQFQGLPGEIEGITARMQRLNEELVKARQTFAASATPIGLDAANAQASSAVAAIQAQIDQLGEAAIEAGRQFRDRVLAEVDAVSRSRLQAEVQASQDVLAAQQQGFQAQESALRASLQAQEITREQFADARVRLARESGAAELKALNEQLRAVQAGPARTDTEKIDRAAQEAHLRAVIALRSASVGIQVQEIRNEERLARLAEAREIAARAAQSLQTIPRIEIGVPLKPQISPTELTAAVQRVAAAVANIPVDNALQRQFEADAVAARRLAAETRALSGGILSVIGALRGISDSAADALTNVFSLVNGLRDVAAANEAIKEASAAGDVAAQTAANLQRLEAIGSTITAGVGALSTILGGIFSKGAAEREHDAIQLENNRRLAELTSQLKNQGGLGNLDRAQQALANRDVLSAVSLAPILTPIQGLGQVTAGINAKLQAFGLSLDDLARIVKDTTGIQILDSKGRILADQFDEAQKAMQAFVEATLRFANTFDEQQHLASLQAAFGTPAGQPQPTQIELDLTALKALNTGIDDRFKGIDTRNAEQLRRVFQQLVQDFQAGRISAAELGDLSREDFLRFLDDGATGLKELADGTRDAMDQIANVPSGFKQAAAAFNATVEGLTAQAPVQPVSPFLPGGPRGTDGAALPVDASKDFDRLVDSINKAQQDNASRIADAIKRVQPSENNVTIEGANVDLDTLVDRVLEALERRDTSRRGNTTPGLQGGF